MVPLPRFAGEDPGSRPAAPSILPRLRQGCPGKVVGESKCRRRMPRETGIFRLPSGCRDSERDGACAL
ncbi:hypothetical protein C7I84_24145, partial [Mesorhizobium ephedrae]